DIEDPLTAVLAFLKAPGQFDVRDPSRPASFGEPDLRLANRGGARISTAQIAAILERRDPIERALRDIPPGTSLSREVGSVPWLPLRRLFDAFADIRGVGLAKTTKALYPKRPALIPMLDSIVQKYLYDDDLGAQAPFAERALGLVRGYQRDLDRNWAPVQVVRHDLTRRGYRLTALPILDLLLFPPPPPPPAPPPPPGGTAPPPLASGPPRQWRPCSKYPRSAVPPASPEKSVSSVRICMHRTTYSLTIGPTPSAVIGSFLYRLVGN